MLQTLNPKICSLMQAHSACPDDRAGYRVGIFWMRQSCSDAHYGLHMHISMHGMIHIYIYICICVYIDIYVYIIYIYIHTYRP